MNNYFKAAAAILLSAFSIFLTPAYAQDDADYYGIKNETISITEGASGKEVMLRRPELLSDPILGNKDVAAATALVNTGIAAWNVISGGSPSGAASSAYASALPPAFYMTWNSVANWKGPQEYFYTYTVTNLMGVDVIKVKYKISFFYGGTEDYTDRAVTPMSVTGKYLTNFTVTATDVDVKWGWHFNLDAIMSHPMNVGTVLKPVAFLKSDLRWTVSNMLLNKGGAWSYTIDGNGNFKDLNAAEKALTKEIPPVKAAEIPAVSWN